MAKGGTRFPLSTQRFVILVHHTITALDTDTLHCTAVTTATAAAAAPTLTTATTTIPISTPTTIIATAANISVVYSIINTPLEITL